MPNFYNGMSRGYLRLGMVVKSGALAVLLAGCASQGSQQVGTNSISAMQGAAPVGPEISTFLDNATPGSIAAFASSPWGSNVSLIVQDRYFAASGRLCTHIDVARESVSGAAPQGHVACIVEDQGWYTQRLVTQVSGRASVR